MKDLQSAHDNHQPIIIQATEGAQFIAGHLDRVEESYKRGLRILQLVHERDDTSKPLGDIYTGTPHLGGLTPFGAQVIKECNRLGIVLDLEHGSHETIAAALETSTHPIIVSHTGLVSDPLYRNASPDMQQRLLTKDHAREISDAGGLIGVWWRLTDSTRDYVIALRGMADTVGIDHVGIGTDTDLTSSDGQSYTNKIWPDQHAGFFYAIVAEMLKQNFTPDEITKIGGANFCRIFAKVTATHA
jgi:membrane dipeptidase